MIRQQSGFTLFELTLVVCIVGILMAVWVRYADGSIERAERVALESISHSFASSMGALRGKWLIENNGSNPKQFVLLNQQKVYVNRFGWPTNTTGVMVEGSSQTPEACQQLWQVVMQYAAPASVEGREPRGSRRYHISAPAADICRYELAGPSESDHYFNYNRTTGQVEIHIPPLN